MCPWANLAETRQHVCPAVCTLEELWTHRVEKGGGRSVSSPDARREGGGCSALRRGITFPEPLLSSSFHNRGGNLLPTEMNCIIFQLCLCSLVFSVCVITFYDYV